MLLQSQWTEKRDGNDLRVIHLLPALPKAWPTGSIKGLCVRDGFVVDFDWDKNQLTRTAIHSKLGKPCLLRCGDHELVLKTQAGKDYTFDGKLQPLSLN
jgi:alpha-L-fucosidase 2